MSKPSLIDAPLPAQKAERPIPTFPGGPERTCSNCEHFEIRTGDGKRAHGRCHNGISQKYDTRAIDGCGYGFYPAVDRFPLKAGPGGVWG